MYHSDYENFISNPMWKEIVITIKETLRGLHDDIAEMAPYGEDAIKLARQQGRIKMAEFILMLPEDMLREIEEDKQREERKNG